MRTSPETGCIGGYEVNKQFSLGVGGGRVGVTELHGDSPLLYCLQHTPAQSTLYMRTVLVTLLYFKTPWPIHWYIPPQVFKEETVPLAPVQTIHNFSGIQVYVYARVQMYT